MTKSFLLLIVLFASACSNQSDTQNKQSADSATTESTQPAAEPGTANAGPSNAGAENAAASSDVKEKAIELIAKSDCLTCHAVDEKKVGPAYRDVANKYVADEQTKTLLAEKIIKGGSGVWGPVPMTPHPTISEEDAKTMVTYILSLKQK
jgi:cytochrome c